MGCSQIAAVGEPIDVIGIFVVPLGLDVFGKVVSVEFSDAGSPHMLLGGQATNLLCA